jgi:hypothetical protein
MIILQPILKQKRIYTSDSKHSLETFHYTAGKTDPEGISLHSDRRLQETGGIQEYCSLIFPI